MSVFRNYFKDIFEGINSSAKGLGLTLKHLLRANITQKPMSITDSSYFSQPDGIVTLQYPSQSIPVPDNGRYRLHNEIDDCIVCDKCAKICPVNCIDITSVKSAEEIGITSDGSSKRLYAATFDIDMAKCCFCGLCTTVCPTECLTMTSTYDFSELDVTKMVYHFSDLTPEQAQEKQRQYELKQAEKAAALAAKKNIAAPAEQNKAVNQSSTDSRPAFKPKLPVSKPVVPSPEATPAEQESGKTTKPVFRPKLPVSKNAEIKEVVTDRVPQSDNSQNKTEASEALKIHSDPQDEIWEKGQDAASQNPKPVFKPKMPGIKNKEESQPEPNPQEKNESQDMKAEESNQAPSKPVFKPKMKPVIPPKTQEGENQL